MLSLLTKDILIELDIHKSWSCNTFQTIYVDLENFRCKISISLIGRSFTCKSRLRLFTCKSRLKLFTCKSRLRLFTCKSRLLE